MFEDRLGPTRRPQFPTQQERDLSLNVDYSSDIDLIYDSNDYITRINIDVNIQSGHVWRNHVELMAPHSQRGLYEIEVD